MQEEKVVVVGCGHMGCDIAAIFLNAGWRVEAVESSEEGRAAAPGRMQASVKALRGNWDHGLLSVKAAVFDVDWRGARLVIETVSENLATKRKVFQELDEHVPLDIPIGSNSSGFRITDIASDCSSAERMANAHFFLPAHLVPLVELAKGERTSRQTLDALHLAFEDVGRVVVRIQKDLPGFLANRIQHALMREAFSIIEAGLATPEDVDKAVRYGFGFRYVAAGPILQKELSGLDTQLAAASSIYPSLCNDPRPPAMLRELVAEGRSGTKALQGFWRWTPEQVERERQRFEAILDQAADLVRQSPAVLPEAVAD